MILKSKTWRNRSIEGDLVIVVLALVLTINISTFCGTPSPLLTGC